MRKFMLLCVLFLACDGVLCAVAGLPEGAVRPEQNADAQIMAVAKVLNKIPILSLGMDAVSSNPQLLPTNNQHFNTFVNRVASIVCNMQLPHTLEQDASAHDHLLALAATQTLTQFDMPAPNRLFVAKFTQAGLVVAMAVTFGVLLISVPVMMFHLFLVWHPLEGNRSTYFKGITSIFLIKLFLNLIAATWAVFHTRESFMLEGEAAPNAVAATTQLVQARAKQPSIPVTEFGVAPDHNNGWPLLDSADKHRSVGEALYRRVDYKPLPSEKDKAKNEQAKKGNGVVDKVKELVQGVMGKAKANA